MPLRTAEAVRPIIDLALLQSCNESEQTVDDKEDADEEDDDIKAVSECEQNAEDD